MNHVEFLDKLDKTDFENEFTLNSFRSNWDTLDDDEKWKAFCIQYLETTETLREAIVDMRKQTREQVEKLKAKNEILWADILKHVS